MIKKSFLKNILTTASTMAVLVAGVQSASAADRVTTGAANFDGTNLNPGGAIVNGEKITFHADAVTLETGGEDTSAFAAGVLLDLNNKNVGDFTVSDDTKIGSIVSTGGAKTIDIAFDTAAKTLTIGGNADAVGTIDFDNNASTVVFSDDVTLANAVDATGGAVGTLTFNGEATINGAVGATNALTAVNFNGDATVNEDTKATTTTVAAGKTLTLAAGKVITGEVKAAGAAAKLALTGSVAGQIGDGQAFAEVNYLEDQATGGAVAATKVTVADGKTLTVNHVITGAVDGAAAGKGKLALNGNVVVGKIGATAALEEVNFTADYDLGANDRDISATNMKLTGAATHVTINDNTLTGDIDGAAVGQGKLTFDHANSKVAGNIGDTKALAEVNFNENYTTQGNVKAAAIKVTAAKTLTVADGHVVDGALTRPAGGVNAKLVLAGAATLGNAGADITTADFEELVLDAGKALTVTGGTFQSDVKVAANADKAITAKTADVEFIKLVLEGDKAELVSTDHDLKVTEFTGAGTKLAKVTISGADTASADLDVDNKMTTIDEVDFGATSGTLTLSTAAGDGEINLTKITNADNKGKLVLNAAGGQSITLKTLGEHEKFESVDLSGETGIIGAGQTLKSRNTTNGTLGLENGATLKGNSSANIVQIGADAEHKSTVEGDVTGNITLSKADSTMTVNGSLTGKAVAEVGGATGMTFALNAKQASNFTLNGTAHNLVNLELSGADTALTSTKAAKQITVKGDMKLSLVNDNNGAAIVADSTGHSILANADQTLGSVIAAGGVRTIGTADQTVNFVSNGVASKTFTFAGINATHYADFTTTHDGKGIVAFAAVAGAETKLKGNIGTSENSYEAVNFVDGNEYTGTAYATDFGHADKATVKLTDATLVGDYAFAGAGDLKLAGTTTVGQITTAGAGNENVYVSGAAKATGDWGTAANQLASVDVTGSLDMGSSKLESAAIIVRDGGKLYLGADHTLTGADLKTGATLNTGINTLTIDAGNTIANGSAFAIGLSADTAGTMTHGKIIFNNASVADFDGKTVQLIAAAVPSSESFPAGTIDLTDTDYIAYEAGMTDADKLKLATAAGLADGTLAYGAYDKAAPAAGAGAGAATAANVSQAEALLAKASAAGVNIAAVMPTDVAALADGSAKKVEAQNRVLTADVSVGAATSAATTEVAAAAASAVGGRMIAPAIAKSSGDESLAYGAWATAIGGTATQKSTSKTPIGYKSKLVGGTVGWDAEVAEGTMVGLAATYAKGDVKLKDDKVGDKADTKTMMLNLYAQQGFENDMFVQGMVGYAQTDVKAKSKRVASVSTYDIASSKYKVKGYSASVVGGYSMAVADGVSFTPMAGLKFGKTNQGNITEKGSAQNLAVSVKYKNKVTGLVGARVATNVESTGMVVTPEAHAFLDYNLGSKKAAAHKLGFANQQTRMSQTVEHASKYSVNVGTSVTAKSGMMEYGVGYDATIAKKYVGHQGSLKVRVNF